MTAYYTYRSRDESDKSQLRKLLDAIDGAKSALHLDDCRCWRVSGARGCLYTWGGRTWLLAAFPGSPRKWANLKARLLTVPGAVLTQDGEDEGVVWITKLPTTDEHKRLIRKAIGLRRTVAGNISGYMAKRAQAEGQKRGF